MRKSEIRNSGYFIYENGDVISPNGLKLKTWVENNTGYLLFRIRFNKKPLGLRLHRALAEAFVPNPLGLPFVRHLNDIKNDNRLSNLAWGDNPTNVKEGYENNCYKFHNRRYSVKVTNKNNGEVVIFDSLRSCAEALNLNRKNIAAVLKGQKNNTYNYDFEYYNMPND